MRPWEFQFKLAVLELIKNNVYPTAHNIFLTVLKPLRPLTAEEMGWIDQILDLAKTLYPDFSMELQEQHLVNVEEELDKILDTHMPLSSTG